MSLFEKLGQFGGTLETLAWVLREQSEDHRLQPRGHVRVQLPQRRWFLVANLAKHCHGT